MSDSVKSVDAGSPGKSVLRMCERGADGLAEVSVLTDVMARALSRRESLFRWFAEVYAVPESVQGVMAAIARHPEVRAAGVTLRRMKERGWYASSTNGLWALSADAAKGLVGSPIFATVTRFGDVSGVTSPRRPGRDDPIPDDIWLDAIELTMICCHADEYIATMKDTTRWNWTVTIRNDLPMVYFLVYLLKSREDLQGILEAQSQRLRAAEVSVRVLRSVSASSISREAADAEVTAARERTRVELDAARAEAARLRKYVAVLEHANEDLIRASELVDASQRPSEAVCGVSEISVGEDTSEVFEASEGLSGPSVDDLPELPESGVVFMGGHTRVVRQLRQIHPGWRFVGDVSSAGAIADGPTSSVTVVFCWYKHLTHPTFDRVTAALEGVPVAYVAATNIARLEAEMRLHYADILKKLEE